MKFLQHAELNKDLPRIVSVQNAYNLVNRIYELGSSEIYHHEGVGLLAYSPLAQGYLTGKYQNGALPQGSRKQLFDRLQRYETPGPTRPFPPIWILRKNGDWTPRNSPINL